MSVARVIYAPRPYQRLITAHALASARSGVWAGMGTGKTASTLEAVASRQMVHARPELVLAPLRVAQSTWPDEAAKWSNLSHLEVQPVVGSVKEREAALANRNAAIFTINYENLPWLVDHLGDRWPFEFVTADESTRLKSFRLGGKGGRRARSIARIAHTRIKGWCNLTGTPSPNGLVDLWGQSWFLDAGQRLGRTFGAFEQRWFRKGHNGFGLEPLPSAREQIEDRLRDLHITIDPADWFDLKEPIVNVVRVELPEKAMRIYKDMEKQLYTEIQSALDGRRYHEVEAFGAGARTVKCLQIANGAMYVGDEREQWVEIHDAKLRALESIAEEAMGAPVLVAYHFKSDLARLQRAFPHGRVLDKDPATIRDWNAGKVRLLFAHPASAGHGLNLQDGGNILVFFGHWWSLEEFQQIIERIGPVRQLQAGHKRPVFIHHIVAADTVDELVMARRETKRDVQALLLEAMNGRSGLV
jgi:SNF2 family DNA or RNA helicase